MDALSSDVCIGVMEHQRCYISFLFCNPCIELLSERCAITLFQESVLLWQRKCEDALYSLLILGARRPVRHLASVAMAKIISKGDGISIYSRASSLQGFLSDGKRGEPQRVAG